MNGLDSIDGIHLIWLVGGLVLVVSALATRRVAFGLLLRSVLGWAVIVVLAVFAVSHRYELQAVATAVSSRLGIDDQHVEGGMVRIRMSPDGHFWARVMLNGVERRMLIDSGATITAISPETAAAAHLRVGGGLPAIIETANGSVTAHRATVDRVRIGSLGTRDLGVVVSPNFGDLDVLGMNFLSRLHSWRVENNVLVLEPRAGSGARNPAGQRGDSDPAA